MPDARLASKPAVSQALAVDTAAIAPFPYKYKGQGRIGHRMEDEIAPEPEVASGRRAGVMLAEARAAAKLDLAEVASRTRIPRRHLEAIEAGDYAKLPSRTYAVGFSRTYARVVGLNEREVTEQVRLDLEAGDPQGPARPDRFEPGDPARVPSRRLAWFSALAAVILVAGAFTFYRTYFSPGLGPAPLTAPTAAATQPRITSGPGSARAVTAAPPGPVVFTSLADGTWVKFYDVAGKRLFEGQMARGQTFTVPADAVEPKAWTGRPNALSITVGGRPVPMLGTSEVVVKDVPIDAAALLARPPQRAAAPAATPAT